ncbi:hypothetical protein BS17DRAFT_883169 [Gyrodon lividus]|nr:hypothetical protein BS17DRAFT_883169 [Gyrodon lividus]
MVNWKDPEVEARVGGILINMIFLQLGLYGWEYFQSSQVEYALIRFRLPFRWSLLPYVAGRLCFLTTVVVLAILTNPTSGLIDCTAAIRFTTFTGNAAIGCASTNLMIRTWIIWRDSRLVLSFLFLITAGHWTILVFGLTRIIAFMTEEGCNVVYADPTTTAVIFLYTMIYDMLVLMFTIVGLSRKPSRSNLWKRLHRQGIAYFAIAFLANIVPMVVCWLDLNGEIHPPSTSTRKFRDMQQAVMNILFAIPATCLSIIASSRAVVSLLDPHPLPSSDASPNDDIKDDDIALTTLIALPTTSIGLPS